MKRGALIAAIDAAPKVYGLTYMGPVAFEKGSLKAALKAHYPGRADETGRTVDPAGMFTLDPTSPPPGG